MSLSDRYSSMGAYHQALAGVSSNQYPLGNPWETVTESEGASQPSAGARKSRGKKKQADGPSTPFVGDRTLAQDILLKMDLLFNKEMVMSLKTGHVGRLWEAVKVSSSAA
jgi:hypothetical protein